MERERACWAGRILIRTTTQDDNDAIWRIIGPAICEGETYAIDRDISREDALCYWTGEGQHGFVATNSGAVALSTKLGFDAVGRLPDAFNHQRWGLVDALVMSRKL